MNLREYLTKNQRTIARFLGTRAYREFLTRESISFERALAILRLLGWKEEHAHRLLSSLVCEVRISLVAPVPDYLWRLGEADAQPIAEETEAQRETRRRGRPPGKPAQKRRRKVRYLEAHHDREEGPSVGEGPGEPSA